MLTFIYGLVSSRDGGNLIWYVGQSFRVQERFGRHHLRESNGAKGKWVQKELAEGFAVSYRILEECPDEAAANVREDAWIDACRKINSGLTNGIFGSRVNAKRAKFLAKCLAESREQLERDREWVASLGMKP